MSEIVKVQVPIFGYGPALVYDRNHKHKQHATLTVSAHKKMDGDLKAFFNATLTHKKTWKLLERVEDQDW